MSETNSSWRRNFSDWAPVVGWTLLIYSAIPLARSIQTWVTEHWTRAVFSWVVYACIALGFLLAIRHLRRTASIIRRRQWVLLTLLSAVFAWGTWQLRGNAEEALHFVQYGVLSLLLYRAFRNRYADRGVYFAAFFLGAFLGILDEVIQWAVPRRLFDFRDIFINLISVLLVQLGLSAGLASAPAARSAGYRSARTAWRLAVLCIALMLACASNTPDMWKPWYSYRPSLFVFDEAMVEYGHRHIDPAVGAFNSRLHAEEIRETDARRAGEIAEIMRQRGRDADYSAFLRRYSAITDPFLHEFRVRLFRRDHYWREARANRDDAGRHGEWMTVAFGEQRLLENWYSNCLQAAGVDWPDDLRARAAAVARPGPYDSPVSRELVTRWTLRQAQTVLTGLLLAVYGVGRYDVHRRRRRYRTAAAAPVP